MKKLMIILSLLSISATTFAGDKVTLALESQYSCNVYSIYIIKDNHIVRNAFPTGVSLVTSEALRGEKCISLSPNSLENIIPHGCIPISQDTVASIGGGLLEIGENFAGGTHSLSITLSNGIGRFDASTNSGESVEVLLRSCKIMNQ